MSDVDLRMGPASMGAADLLMDQGFRVASKPVSDRIPRLPKDITSLHDEALMDLFVEVTSWVDYTSVQVACAQVDEKAAERKLSQVEAVAMVDASVGKTSVSAAKAKKDSDPRVQEATSEYEELHAYRKLIEVLSNNLDRDAALISRELTRRTSTPTPTRRAGKYL